MPKSIPGVLREWKQGKLHSGASNGPVVKSQKQAVAIALSEQQQQKAAARMPKPLHPALKAHGAKVAQAHAELDSPAFRAQPAATRMRAIQQRIRHKAY